MIVQSVLRTHSDRKENTEYIFFADIYSKMIHLHRNQIIIPGLNLNPFITVRNGHAFNKKERKQICDYELFGRQINFKNVK